MKYFNRIFLSGLLGILPLFVTIYIVYSIVIIFENIFSRILPASILFPGMGLLLGFLFIFLVGLMLNNFITAKLVASGEAVVGNIPFIKAIYGPLKDVLNLFARKDNKSLKAVVLVELAPGVKWLGLVTRDRLQDLNLGVNTEGQISVYFPMTYAVGGFTLVVQKEKVSELTIPIEQAMTLAITGWVRAEPKSPHQNQTSQI